MTFLCKPAAWHAQNAEGLTATFGALFGITRHGRSSVMTGPIFGVLAKIVPGLR
jgi:hypothetical protein